MPNFLLSMDGVRPSNPRTAIGYPSDCLSGAFDVRAQKESTDAELANATDVLSSSIKEIRNIDSPNALVSFACRTAGCEATCVKEVEIVGPGQAKILEPQLNPVDPFNCSVLLRRYAPENI
jgi:hypothetical protein